jgi:hypothetical protein
MRHITGQWVDQKRYPRPSPSLQAHPHHSHFRFVPNVCVPNSEQRQKRDTARHKKCANCPDDPEALFHDEDAD